MITKINQVSGTNSIQFTSDICTYRWHTQQTEINMINVTQVGDFRKKVSFKFNFYITLRHFIRQLHLQWPMVHQQSHSSSPNASLKRWVFKSFLKVSVFVSSWRLDGREFHAFGPENEKLRSPNFSFNRGSSYRKLLEDLSLSWPGRSATDVIMSGNNFESVVKNRALQAVICFDTIIH